MRKKLDVFFFKGSLRKSLQVAASAADSIRMLHPHEFDLSSKC